MEVYLVGGAVRDEQLGLPVSERDWCVVGATPDDHYFSYSISDAWRVRALTSA